MQMTISKLVRRPGRTLLTAAGVALGAATYMAILTGGQGLLSQFRESMNILGAEVVVQQVGVTAPWSSTIPPGTYGELSKLPEVERVSRMILGKTRLPGAAYFLIFGIDTSNSELANLGELEGRSIRPGASPPELLLGRKAAERLGLNCGDLVDLRNIRFRIVGIFRSGRSIPDNGAFVDLPSAQKIFGPAQKANILFLDLKTPDRPQELCDEINRRFPGIFSFPSSEWIDSYGQLAVIQTFSRFLGLIALMIAILGVANVLYVSVLERTKELAILRAIGWTPWRVASLVLLEGLMLSFLGGVLGIPLAQGLLLIVASFDLGGYSGAGLIPLALPFGVALEGLLISVFAGLVGSLVPLARALLLQPARALRSL